MPYMHFLLGASEDLYQHPKAGERIIILYLTQPPALC